MYSDEFKLEFPNEESAQASAKAISVELDNKFEKRAKTNIKTNKNIVLLKVNAKDETAMKASMSSYTRLLKLCLEISL